MFNRDWTVCSNMLTLYDHLLRTRIFTLIMNKIFIRAPKIYEEAMDTIWMYYSSSVRVAYPTREVGGEREVSVLDPLTLIASILTSKECLISLIVCNSIADSLLL